MLTLEAKKGMTMSVKQLFQLDDQVALVTGGSRGLGLQMAAALGEMGCKVAISARKADELKRAKDDLAQIGSSLFQVGRASSTPPAMR